MKLFVLRCIICQVFPYSLAASCAIRQGGILSVILTLPFALSLHTRPEVHSKTGSLETFLVVGLTPVTMLAVPGLSLMPAGRNQRRLVLL